MTNGRDVGIAWDRLQAALPRGWDIVKLEHSHRDSGGRSPENWRVTVEPLAHWARSKARESNFKGTNGRNLQLVCKGLTETMAMDNMAAQIRGRLPEHLWVDDGQRGWDREKGDFR